MELSTTTNIYYRRPGGRKATCLESIAKVAQAGFDCIDFQFDNAATNPNHELRSPDWEANVERIGLALEQYGLRANQAHAPFYEVLDPDLPDREMKEEMTRRSIIAAGRLGVKWIVCHPGTLYGNPRKQEQFQANAQWLKPVLELAGQYDMGVALENIFDKFFQQPGSEVKPDTPLSARRTRGKIRTCRYYANWPEDLAELVDALQPYGKVGACWDTGHGNEMMVDQRASIQILGHRLKALHINDNFGVFDDHLIPYFGNIRWDEILLALKEIGYQGELTFETGANFIHVPEELVDDALRYAVKVGRYMIRQYESIQPETLGGAKL
jgi:sugar phosphate isomerase/epimerase